nr:hypothetical protein [uncultured bacterium]
MAADFIDELVITSKAIEEVDECREIFTVKKIREDLAVFLKGSSAKEIEAKGVETIMAEFEKNVYVLYSQEVPTFQDALSVVSIKNLTRRKGIKIMGQQIPGLLIFNSVLNIMRDHLLHKSITSDNQRALFA